MFPDGLIPAARPFVRLTRSAVWPDPPSGLPPPMRPAGRSAKRTARGHAAVWPRFDKRHSILTSFVRLCPFTIKALCSRLAQSPCTPQRPVRRTRAHRCPSDAALCCRPHSDARTPCPRPHSDAYAPAADARADAQREQVRRLANRPSSLANTLSSASSIIGKYPFFCTILLCHPQCADALSIF